jgi:hypothetical protein
MYASAIKIQDPIDGTTNFQAGEMTYLPYPGNRVNVTPSALGPPATV